MWPSDDDKLWHTFSGLVCLLLLALSVHFVVRLLGCHPLPSTVIPDASDAATLDAQSPAAAACARLAGLGCAEGLDPYCERTVEHVLATRLTPFDTTCIAQAASVAAVKQCHAIRCAQDGGAP